MERIYADGIFGGERENQPDFVVGSIAKDRGQHGRPGGDAGQ